MRTTYKSLFGVLVSAALFALPPMQVLAITDGDNEDGQTSSKLQEIEDYKLQKESEKVAKLAEICTKYTNSRMTGDVETKQGELESKLNERESELSEKRQDWDTKRDEARSLADSKRQEHYAKMLANAVDEPQKLAIAEFQSSVENAVSKRRSAQDDARRIYREGVDAVLKERKGDLESAASEFKQAVESAIAKAKTSCLNGTPIDTVKASLKADLDAAKSSLKEAQSQVPNVSDTIKQLVDDRKSAIDQAKTDFEEELEAAKAKLSFALQS